MRSFRQFVIDIVKKPPVLFPLVGLFHVVWLVGTLWFDRPLYFPDVGWLELVWMPGYTLCWLAACDLRKWGANGYILLTVIDLALFIITIKNSRFSIDYTSNMRLLDVLFSLPLLYYYKLFQ